jgi:hypothetical protein
MRPQLVPRIVGVARRVPALLGQDDQAAARRSSGCKTIKRLQDELKTQQRCNAALRGALKRRASK